MRKEIKEKNGNILIILNRGKKSCPHDWQWLSDELWHHWKCRNCKSEHLARPKGKSENL